MSQFLSKVIGQKNAISILEKFSENKNFPHALLFNGKKGIGKFFTAIQFAKEINLEIISTQSIKNKFNSLSEPYIKYIFPLDNSKLESILFESQAKLSKEENKIWLDFQEYLQNKIKNPYYYSEIKSTSSIRISQIRSINKFLTLDYTEIPYRVIIIEDAEQMTEQAQNSLLKNLEEPPKGFIFILISSMSENLLPTIRSRCQEIKFDALNHLEINKIIKEYFEIDEKISEELYQLSQGSVNEAIELLGINLNEIKEVVLNILRYGLAGKFQTSFNYYSKYATDIKKILIINSLINMFFRDCTKLKNVKSEDIFFHEYVENLRNFNTKFPYANLSKLYNKLSLFDSMVERNINLTMLVLDIIFEIRQLGKNYV